MSSDGRLTLVIDYENGEAAETKFSFSPRTELVEAIKDLQAREGTTRKNIGCVSTHGTGKSLPAFDRTTSTIREWARAINLDAAIWTALPPNFAQKMSRPFSVKNAYDYLASLRGATRLAALHYIQSAPTSIMTPLRREILKRPIPLVPAV